MNSSAQRGLAAAKARNPADAAKYFDIALQENPDDLQVRIWLGQSLCNAGQRNDGLAHLHTAGKSLLEQAEKTRDIGRALDITMQLQQLGDFHGALELGCAAVNINSTDFRGFQLLAVTYSQLNMRGEALSAGQKALELAPDHTMMQILQGSLEADAGQNGAAKDRLEKVLCDLPNPREEFRAHKELARVLDKLREFDQVFTHLHAAGRLSSALPEYDNQDRALIPNMLKANKAEFDEKLLSRWSGTEFPEHQPPPSFLIGFMRSGTTLTQEVLGAHPKVFLADEADFIWATQRELHQMDRSSASTAEKLRKLDLAGILHLRQFYWDRARGRFGENVGQRGIFLDKFTMNTIDLGFINCIFPDSKVVFVMRDPRDVCISCFMQLMVPTPATAHLLSWQGTADFYALVMDWWMHIKELMSLEFIEFRYEDAVTQFEPTYRRVFEFLGLPWDPAVVDFHKHAAKKTIASPSRNQVTQPLYSSSVTRWRNYEAEFSPVAEILKPFVNSFDYEAF
jgi:Flp pilus assembly protein TadD